MFSGILRARTKHVKSKVATSDAQPACSLSRPPQSLPDIATQAPMGITYSSASGEHTPPMPLAAAAAPGAPNNPKVGAVQVGYWTDTIAYRIGLIHIGKISKM